MTPVTMTALKFAIEVRCEGYGHISWQRAAPILIVCLFSARGFAGPEREMPALIFRSDANEVHLIFSASDQDDHGVATLRPTDVVVIDRDIVVGQFQI
jgi:hypothetical protein